tara:strand:- start:205 stop:363 length:159 start_codon:yes stop_codon:yes gene_type:complete
MVAAFIFILIFGTFIALRRPSRRLGLILFTASMVCVVLLFLHHATDPLGLSF